MVVDALNDLGAEEMFRRKDEFATLVPLQPGSSTASTWQRPEFVPQGVAPPIFEMEPDYLPMHRTVDERFQVSVLTYAQNIQGGLVSVC